MKLVSLLPEASGHRCVAFLLTTAVALSLGHCVRAAQPTIAWNAETGQAVVANGRLELVVDTKSGINPRSLRDTAGGAVYADRDYVWGRGGLPKMEEAPVIADSGDGSRSITFRGRSGDIAIEQTYSLPAGNPGVIIEQITIRNTRQFQRLRTADFHCGFAKRLRSGETWSPDASQIRFSPVPYRRETNGRIHDFPLREVAEHGTTYAGWESPQPTPIWGGEGWVWSKGSAVLLIAKHNTRCMEWSLMAPEKRGTETVLRFGGAGQWKHGHPESSTRLDPGESCQFGETRFQLVDGDWKQAFYAYRRYSESKGCKTPAGYNPPVHWNELYDNQYFFKVGGALGDQNVWYTPAFNADNQKLLAEFYSRDLILAEAAKAKQLGCEALYLDPGWDTGPSHHLWDAGRLGTIDSFLKTCRDDYGLKVSLWIGTGGMPPTYADPEACPPEARVVDRNGRRTNVHCFACPAFLDTKEKRLLELSRHGIAFMMFDSTQFSGPCYGKTHGHRIPSTREEHVGALLELVRRVKTKYPNLLVELHDPVSGPGGNHYTPTYFGYARPHSFDCLWGHEFMWNSMDDLLSGRAVSLYYFNLAYSIPLYLHVSLKPDNENALVFWWFASTCRHLGMGGKSPNPAVWKAHKRAMQTYLPLKRFYTQGTFYGIDETIHAHTLADQRESVLNVFNLSEKPVEKTVRIRLADIGLPEGPIKVKVNGLSSIVSPGKSTQLVETSVTVPIPAHGHQLVSVKVL
jgi:hypothetical protein